MPSSVMGTGPEQEVPIAIKNPEDPGQILALPVQLSHLGHLPKPQKNRGVHASPLVREHAVPLARHLASLCLQQTLAVGPGDAEATGITRVGASCLPQLMVLRGYDVPSL